MQARHASSPGCESLRFMQIAREYCCGDGRCGGRRGIRIDHVVLAYPATYRGRKTCTFTRYLAWNDQVEIPGNRLALERQKTLQPDQSAGRRRTFGRRRGRSTDCDHMRQPYRRGLSPCGCLLNISLGYVSFGTHLGRTLLRSGQCAWCDQRQAGDGRQEEADSTLGRPD